MPLRFHAGLTCMACILPEDLSDTGELPAQVLTKFDSIQLLTWEASLRNALPWSRLRTWSEKVSRPCMWIVSSNLSIQCQDHSGFKLSEAPVEAG